MKPVPIGQLLRRGSPGAGRLQAIGARLAELEEQVHKFLPHPLWLHCRVGGINNNTLILFVDSPAWATRLRYMAAQLARQLNAAGVAPVKRIEVRILPAQADPAPPRQPARPRLSDANARLLDSLANSIGDKSLSQALRRLARRSK